jgi:NAD(P)-dependent dehydrogenase (short-subunit alcohol dehydrogenase family)
MSILDRFRLDGRTAVVTGGSRGLGYAMATALAEAGAQVVLVGRDATPLSDATTALLQRGNQATGIVGDVSTPAGAEAVCEAILKAHPVVDVLVNNVGGRRLDVSLAEQPVAQWQELFDLNLTSALVCSQRLGAGMLTRQRGSIINISSIAGPIAMKGIGGRHYEAAKAALSALTRSLAADWASRGVRVNAIAPGVFATQPNLTWFAQKPGYDDTFLAHIPMERFGEPHELGGAVVYLASDAGSYTTGATLVVDGGFTCW